MLLIGQLHYETTSKYNFPQLLKETGFSRIVELSLSSMETAEGKIFQLDNPELLEPFTEPVQERNSAFLGNKIVSTMLLPLKSIPDGTPVIGIDASSIKIGVTEIGTVYAVRGVVVQNVNNKYRYFRFGPLTFHITRENSHEILKEMDEDRKFVEGKLWFYTYLGNRIARKYPTLTQVIIMPSFSEK